MPPDSVAEAIDHVLHEVQAARRDLRMTRFFLQQAEALRRIERAKASLADLATVRFDIVITYTESSKV